MYSVAFLITFGGAISNFGILLRQRIMVTPLVLMLICAKQKLLVREAPRLSGNAGWRLLSTCRDLSFRQERESQELNRHVRHQRLS